MHVHVQSQEGEAKVWLEPAVMLAHNHGLGPAALLKALTLVKEHEQEIRQAWQKHCGR